MAEFDPWFTFAHDYSSHRYDCPIAEGGMANILGCSCGFDNAWSEAEAFVHAAEARVEAQDVQLLAVLAAFYDVAPVVVAELCDTRIDPSGALLGKVRAAVASARAALAAALPERQEEREAFHDTRADDFNREQMERADREDATALHNPQETAGEQP